MQATPAVVSIRVQPPQSVTVGDVFSVSVFVGIASGAPVAQVCPALSHALGRTAPAHTDRACVCFELLFQVKVTALLTDVTTGTFLESVASFIDKVSTREHCRPTPPWLTITTHQASAKDQEPRKEWVKPVLEPTRVVAITDSYVQRRFPNVGLPLSSALIHNISASLPSSVAALPSSACASQLPSQRTMCLCSKPTAQSQANRYVPPLMVATCGVTELTNAHCCGHLRPIRTSLKC